MEGEEESDKYIRISDPQLRELDHVKSARANPESEYDS